MTARSDRRLDLVVYGATSFVGQILCRHLVERHGTNGSLRWAIAGRDEAKLNQVATDTGADVERIIADATDPEALDSMALSTKVVVSTVGPYALYGSELVRAVVEAGTDYCDLTGETQWMRRMIDTHSEAARKSGSRVVHTCGFDSIPSDLGVWFTQQQSVERLGANCDRISMRLKAMGGGLSGGTIASMMNLLDEASSDKNLRSILANPYALAPPQDRSGVQQSEIKGPTNDKVSGQWAAPFVMAAVNIGVVHRSHALLGHPWGPDFRYDEAMLMGSGPLGAAKAAALSAGIIAGMGVASISKARQVLNKYALPKPGTGPSPEAQEKGFFDIRFFGETPTGGSIRTKVTGDRDPGYGCTSRMLGEAAFALVELADEQVVGGFWTPSTAFGDDLIRRLEDHAGVRFEVLD